jgi:hypothetical protein
MSIKTYTPVVEVSGYASVKRICSFCKNPWIAQVKISARVQGGSSYIRPDEREAIKTQISANMLLKQEEEKAKKQSDRGVLCPSCEHFSIDAMSKHFPKGYLAGIKRKYMWSLLVSLLLIPPCGMGATLFGGGLLLAPSKNTENKTVIIIFLVILALFFVSYLAVNLWYGIRMLFGYNRVKKHLQSMSEDDLLHLAVSCYRENNSSLGGNSLLDGGIYKWGDMLLNRSKSSR